jgi:SAM-dependent methyltransferase
MVIQGGNPRTESGLQAIRAIPPAGPLTTGHYLPDEAILGRGGQRRGFEMAGDEKTEKKKPGFENNPRKGMFKRAMAQVEQLATTTVKEGDGFVQHLYDDYETYRKVQEQGNKAKLRAQFVKKEHIFFLADWLKARGKVSFGLCHGVRRGKEQKWFMKRLEGARVIGTDISETATEFENTVQWDFHDDNPEWQGRADFVYSNSWDHAYDPAKAFRAWAQCLVPGGVILIDHTSGHLPKSSNTLDPFGATREAVIRILEEGCAGLGRVTEVLDRSGDPDYPSMVIVLTRD